MCYCFKRPPKLQKFLFSLASWEPTKYFTFNSFTKTTAQPKAYFPRCWCVNIIVFSWFLSAHTSPPHLLSWYVCIVTQSHSSQLWVSNGCSDGNKDDKGTHNQNCFAKWSSYQWDGSKMTSWGKKLFFFILTFCC